MMLSENIIEEYIHSVPAPILIVPTILILLGLFLVFMPNTSELLFPLGLKGRARRIFSWFFLIFVIITSIYIFLCSLQNLQN